MGAEFEIVLPLRDRVSAVILGRTAYGWVVAGDNQDSDYGGDNRTLEWSRSNNDAGDGHVFDLEGGIGLRFAMEDERWSLSPLVGYAYYEQGLVMQDGYQSFSDQALVDSLFPGVILPQVGNISGLDSSYHAWWYGPWLGMQITYQQNEKLKWDCLLRWHEVDFEAEADWNLRDDLMHPLSFEQLADGDGISLAVDVQYDFDKRYAVGADLAIYDLQAKNGIDVVYLNGGGVSGTRLNEVNWESWALSLSAKYRF